jgi:hypothetical protein
LRPEGGLAAREAKGGWPMHDRRRGLAGEPWVHPRSPLLYQLSSRPGDGEG